MPVFAAYKKLVLLALGACLVFSPARAGANEYAEPALPNIVKILVRYGVFDLRKDNAIDFYAKATECEIFRSYYLDDFKWNKVRAALRQKVKNDIASFPTGVYYDAALQLGKYDFREGLYRFSDKTSQFSANVFAIYIDPSRFCTDDTPNVLPREYRFVLDEPVHIDGLPMSEAEGNKLLNRLRAGGNKDLKVYVRFNMRASYVAPIEAVGDERKEEQKDTFVLSQKMRSGIRIDAHLDSIEYFEDPERTKLIYRFTP